MAGDWQVVAAIDFGTHGTGWAWATVDAINNDPSRRQINYNAEHRGTTVSYPKDLSALLLENGGFKAKGFEARRRWSKERPAGEAGSGDTGGLGYAYAFKMLLKPEVYSGDVPRGEGAVRMGGPADAQNLIVLYLRQVYEEVVADVGKRSYRPDHIRWCLTVPAIWDEADRSLMRKAAVAAGLPDDDDRLLLVIEPEAAALYCTLRNAHVLGRDSRELLDLEQGTHRFMVVDCGGGTVDITAYKVTRAPDGSARLAEIGQPDGGKFGSEYTNAALIDDFLARRLGADVVDKARRECPGDLYALQEAWEKEKTFLVVEAEDGKPTVVEPVLLELRPMLWSLLDEQTRCSLEEEYGSKWGITVPGDEVQKIFDAVVDPTLAVVRRQLETMRKRDGRQSEPEILVLVGGFGRSEYLQQRMAAEFAGEAKVLLAEDPALAVMFGAVHFCYNPSVIRARSAKYTVGYRASMPFRHGTDPLETQHEDEDGNLFCSTRFARLVSRGQSVEVDFGRRISVSPVLRSQAAVTVEVFATPDEREPDWVTSANGKLLGTVTVDLQESVGRPTEERDVDLFFYFGNTETKVRAVNPRTAQEVEAVLDVDYVR